MLFDTSEYKGSVWLQVQDPQFASATDNFQATYDGGSKSIDFSDGQGGTTLMSAPVSLSNIGAEGLDITHSNGAVLYLFYDNPSGNSRTAAPSQMVSTLRFQPLELTLLGNSGDQGNLTAINYFTAPLSIKSYENNPNDTPSEQPLQQTGFGSTTAAEIAALYDTATAGNQDAVVTNGRGDIVRYLGPSNGFSGDNPWPSLIPYMQAVNQAGQSTHLLRTNGFNFAAPDDTPVYQFGLDMQATAGADGTVTITGDITVTVNDDIKPGNPALPDGGAWSGATFTLSAADANDFNNAVYGQVQNAAVSYTGQQWENFKTFTENTLKDPSQPHDPTTNPSLDDLGAHDTTIRMFIGEITTGIIGGFLNSDHMVGGTAIKDMPSNQWWALDPLVAFSEIQPDNPYYNTYADVIYDKSNNGCYGVPYSDRFGSGPLVNSVEYNSTPVNYWVIGVGAPLSVKQGAIAPALLLLRDELVPASQ